MLTQYETVFILTPVLSEDDAKKSISNYVELIKSQGVEIVHEEHYVVSHASCESESE